MPTKDHRYIYTAFVTGVYDGDSITMDIDLGLKLHIIGEKCRLARINAPEMRGPEKLLGLASRDYLRSLILGKEVIVKTIKDKKGKYGRYIIEVWLDGVNINDQMVANNYAAFKDY